MDSQRRMTDEQRKIVGKMVEHRDESLAVNPHSTLGLLYAAWAELTRMEQAANKLLDYCELHEWGLMPEPYDSVNPLLELLGRGALTRPKGE